MFLFLVRIGMLCREKENSLRSAKGGKKCKLVNGLCFSLVSETAPIYDLSSYCSLSSIRFIAPLRPLNVLLIMIFSGKRCDIGYLPLNRNATQSNFN